eukprot:510552-Pelagomonas_calceolata.AAC.1
MNHLEHLHQGSYAPGQAIPAWALIVLPACSHLPASHCLSLLTLAWAQCRPNVGAQYPGTKRYKKRAVPGLCA